MIPDENTNQAPDAEQELKDEVASNTHEPDPIPPETEPKTAGEEIANWNPDEDPVKQDDTANAHDTGSGLADDGTAVGDPPADTNAEAENVALEEQGLDPIHASHNVDVQLDDTEVQALGDGEPIAAAVAAAPLSPPPLSTDAISVKNDPDKPDTFERVVRVIAAFKGTDTLGNVGPHTQVEDDLGIGPQHWGRLGDMIGEEFGIHVKRTDAGNFGKIGDIVHTVLRTARLSG